MKTLYYYITELDDGRWELVDDLLIPSYHDTKDAAVAKARSASSMKKHYGFDTCILVYKKAKEDA